MWYDHHRHRRSALRARVVAVVAGLVGVGVVSLGMLGLAVGVGMLATDDHPGIAVLTTLVSVLIATVAVVMLWRARARWLLWRRLDALARELERVPTMPPADLEIALGWPRQALCEALLQAACVGMVAQLPIPLFQARKDTGSLAPGDILDGRFRLVAVLGEGGMGRVFHAVDVFSGGPVALKIPHDGVDRRERLEREAELLLQLDHPYVQRLRYVGRIADGTPYLVSDLLQGESLERRLERLGTIPLREAVALVTTLADALDATHGAGVLHRDLKPSNVLLEQRSGGEEPVLIDFGLARVLAPSTSTLTRSGAVAGTPLYMSPEQALGEPLDPRSDVYGLALLLYEMVTGTPPSFEVTEAKIFERLLHQSVTPMAQYADVPPGLDAVVAKGLAKDRNDRYPSAGAFAHALTASLYEGYHVA